MVSAETNAAGTFPAAATSLPARENVVLVEAHPDDLPGHMGTALLLARKYNVHVVDFTHGERGLGEAGYLDGTTAKLRTAEETAVCGEAGFTLHWLDEIDGDAFASRATCTKLAALLKDLKPRAVFCHWPVDIHPDHVMSAATAMKAVRLAKIAPEIYFHEQDRQSRAFAPAYYVEIAPVAARKAALVAKYVCQQGSAIAKRKDESNIVYGRNSGLQKAEVFQVFRGTVKPGHGVLDELELQRGGACPPDLQKNSRGACPPNSRGACPPNSAPLTPEGPVPLTPEGPVPLTPDGPVPLTPQWSVPHNS